MTKVLLTGAAGHLGSVAYRQLLEDGFEVRATDRSRRPGLPGRVEVANLLDREACYQLAEGLDCIVHLGNIPNAHLGTPQQVFIDNVSTNMNIFQAALESGARMFIYASSIQVIAGPRNQGNGLPSQLPYLPMDGDLPHNPANAYALSKCVGETQLQYFVKQHKIASATAIRFPLLLSREWIKDMPRAPRPRLGRGWGGPALDEGSTWLTCEDASRLISAVIKANLPGYHCYLPAARSPRNGMAVRDFITESFADVPLKKPIEQFDSMVDVSRITQETGWAPLDDLPAPGAA